MEQALRVYFQKLVAIFTQPNLASFLEYIRPDVDNLQNFRFYLDNPVFDLIIISAFFILAKTWGFKRSFSYCLIVTGILCITTQIIPNLNISLEGAGITYGDIIKFLSIVIIIVISIYYFFIKNKQ